MKKLPKIYKNEISKNINNNKEYCYLENIELERSKNVEEELNSIFDGIGYPYNINVLIKTANKEYKTNLISKSKKNIITLDNDVIPIEEIISIKRI